MKRFIVIFISLSLVTHSLMAAEFPKKLIVMFTKNQGCDFCDFMKPIMKESVAGKDIRLLYLDIDQHPQYPAKYGFSTVPQIMYFVDGWKVGGHGSGNYTMTKDKVLEKIDQYLDE